MEDGVAGEEAEKGVAVAEGRPAGFLCFGVSDEMAVVPLAEDELGLEVRCGDKLRDVAERNCKWKCVNRAFDHFCFDERAPAAAQAEWYQMFDRQKQATDARLARRGQGRSQ